MKLERMCQEYIAEFENNLLQLIAVNARLDRRIKLNTRYKDAVCTRRDPRHARRLGRDTNCMSCLQSSSVFTMEASRMGLKQNDLALEQNRYAADQNRVAVEQSKLSYRQTEIAIQQSTVSLSQSSTIQRLTYLTIAYLPAALIAVSHSLSNLRCFSSMLRSTTAVCLQYRRLPERAKPFHGYRVVCWCNFHPDHNHVLDGLLQTHHQLLQVSAQVDAHWARRTASCQPSTKPVENHLP